MKNFFVLFMVLVTLNLFCASNDLDDPKDPTNPTVKGDNSKNNDPQYNINLEYQEQSGIFKKGIIKGLKGFYINNLTWEGNEEGNQKILVDFVKTIRVRGYTMVKKQKENASVVFYFPYIFDIELKNGTTIKNAKGRIKELDSFEVFNDIGKEKCYSYFIRLWLEDKGMFADNNSKNYNETSKVPKSVVIYFEFKD